MKILTFRTFDSTPLGITGGKWNHLPGVFGQAGSYGWAITLTYSWCGKRYCSQVRRETIVPIGKTA